jgi:hypothetical protein
MGPCAPDNDGVMKVFNLQCRAGHRFEGWFGSEGDYESQQERGLVECPLCGEKHVQRLPAAPRLNLHAAAAEPRPPSAERAGVEALWLQAVRHVMAHTEDVGERFAEEARRIHYGEAEQRGIRGRTTSEEAQALDDEGIEVFSLPLPDGLKGSVQ